MTFIRIFLLILIILGVWMIFNKEKWVPTVVDYIMEREVKSNTEKIINENI